MSDPILSRGDWWNTLAAVEIAQAGDPTTDGMNALGLHDEALRAENTRLREERDEAIAAGDRFLDEKKAANVERWDAEARVATLEAALRTIQRTKVIEAVWVTAAAALGDQAAPTEPPCRRCGYAGGCYEPWGIDGETFPCARCDWCLSLDPDERLRQTQSSAAPQAAPEPERCPTCGSDTPHLDAGQYADSLDECPDPWHSAPPEGEQG